MSRRLEQLLRFHEQDPADAFCTYGIAMEHAKAGDTQQALAWLDRTLNIDEHYAYAWYQKARLLGEAGRSEEAAEAIERGLAAAGRSGDGHAAEELSELKNTL